MSQDIQPDCYNCPFRGDLPGDAHSCCNHPLVKKVLEQKESGIYALMALLGGLGRALPVPGLKVIGNEHGVRMGWFAWPFNFDPIWLEECSGYKPIKKRIKHNKRLLKNG